MNNRLVLWIVLGVFVWGTIHALGAYTFNHNPWRFVVVMLFVDGFLAFWLLLLLWRRGRTAGRK